jgi:hypothetical protein
MAAPAPASPPSAAARPAPGDSIDPGLAGGRRTLGCPCAGTPDSGWSHRRAAGPGGGTQGAGGLRPLRGDQSAGHPARVVLAHRASVPAAGPRGQAAAWHQGPRTARLPVHPHPGAGAGSLTTAADPPRACTGDPAGRGLVTRAVFSCSMTSGPARRTSLTRVVGWGTGRSRPMRHLQGTRRQQNHNGVIQPRTGPRPTGVSAAQPLSRPRLLQRQVVLAARGRPPPVTDHPYHHPTEKENKMTAAPAPTRGPRPPGTHERSWLVARAWPGLRLRFSRS